MRGIVLFVMMVAGAVAAGWVFRTYTTYSWFWTVITAIPVGFCLMQGVGWIWAEGKEG